MSTCVNLRELSGGRYRVTYDPAYRPGHVPHDQRDPWMLQIPCRAGCVIYPHGGTTLAVEVNGHKNLAAALRQLGLTCHQDGDAEKTFLFDAADFDRVAAVVRPHRRQRYTAAQRRDMAERLARNLATAEKPPTVEVP
jgi:hypothetical protein